MLSTDSAALNIDLHEKQQVAFYSIATEILYGGAAGGGKSHLMRMAAVTWCTEIAGLQVYLFRRIREDLVKNHMEGPSGFRAFLAGWEKCGFVKIVEDEIRFWNGSKIYLCHCKDEKDRFKYLGTEMHVLIIDELTHFTDDIYRFLRNRVRMVGIEVPEKYKGMFPRILCGANPGGIGHQFVKATFIDGVMPLQVTKAPLSEGGMLRQFIPAQLEDNPSLMESDPGYDARLQGLGSESLVRAMRHGDWNVVEGAFFDNFRADRHVLEPFQIPKDWLRFRAGDWGSARPFSFGWYAIVTDDFRTPNGVVLPRGAMIRYREWYGIETNKDGKFVPNKGLKLTAERVGSDVRLRDANEQMAYGVLDPAAFAEDGGPSIAERMMRGTRGNNGSTFKPADNKRVTARGAMGGWDQLRARLDGDEDGRPMLFFFKTCIHAIRTIPALQHDKDRPEDLDSDMEDHCFKGDTLVRTRKGLYTLADLVGTGGDVLSHDGRWHSFRSARMVKRNQPIVSLAFSDGSTIECTPDHKFLTESGWKEARELAGLPILSLSPPNAKSLRASAITSAGNITSAKAFGFTGAFGKRTTGQSLTGIMSTTSTMTVLAMASATLNAFRSPITLAAGTARQAASVAGTALARLRNALVNGTEALTGLLGIKNSMPRFLQHCAPSESSNANSAAQGLRLSLASFAQTDASQHRVEHQASMTREGHAISAGRLSSSIAIRRSGHAREIAALSLAHVSELECLSVSAAGRADVYCLTVDDTGNFALANGAIVSNCADEVRYACMSRPWVKDRAVEEKKKAKPGQVPLPPPPTHSVGSRISV